MDVPLDQVENALRYTSLRASRVGDVLVVQNERLITKVFAVPPANADAGDARIQAVVKVETEVPPSIVSQIRAMPRLAEMANRYASMGSLIMEDDRAYIGSRVTIYEKFDAWSIHIRLLLSSITSAAPGIFGAMSRSLSQKPAETRESAWHEDEFADTEETFRKLCVCTSGGLGFTAEFGLRMGQTSAVMGHGKTALWQVMGDQPHPELGGGLFCLLRMPHTIRDEPELSQVVNRLNQMEMEPHDLPPHFGAWCPGTAGKNPAYIAFLSNAMHEISGLMNHLTHWAMFRAQIADVMLASIAEG